MAVSTNQAPKSLRSHQTSGAPKRWQLQDSATVTGDHLLHRHTPLQNCLDWRPGFSWNLTAH